MTTRNHITKNDWTFKFHNDFGLNFWSQLTKPKYKPNSCFIVLEVEQRQGVAVQRVPEPAEVDTVQA